ncbi:S8 family serine peptidase [Nonomuraea sp. B19D2]|uniref:S8 family serine peptidase n=1 Tax=Nonomuraea sp. B19D2 TaxID=3159561 RepID=UPI0032DB4D03
MTAGAPIGPSVVLMVITLPTSLLILLPRKANAAMKSSLWSSAITLALTVTALVGTPAASATPTPTPQPTDIATKAVDPPAIDPVLRKKTTDNRKVRVNVLTRSRDQLPAAAAAGTALKTFSRLPVVTMRVDAAGLDRLAAQAGVVSVTEDVPVPPVLAESIPLIGADKTRAAGLTGAGGAVAVLDTGVARSHTFLAGRVVAEACFSPSDAEYGASSLCPDGEDEQEGTGAADSDQGPCAAANLDCDHGTHVAGIAVGNGANVTGAPPAGGAPAPSWSRSRCSASSTPRTSAVRAPRRAC